MMKHEIATQQQTPKILLYKSKETKIEEEDEYIRHNCISHKIKFLIFFKRLCFFLNFLKFFSLVNNKQRIYIIMNHEVSGL